MLALRIGEKIKTLRRLKGISQDALAQKIGVTWEMVSRYERGKSSPLHKLEEIAAAFGVEISELFEASPEAYTTGKLQSPTADYAAPLLIPILSVLPEDPREVARAASRSSLFFSPPYPAFTKGSVTEVLFGISLPIAHLRIDPEISLHDEYLVCQLVNSEVTKEYGTIPSLYFSEGTYAVSLFKKGRYDLLVAIITAAIKIF